MNLVLQRHDDVLSQQARQIETHTRQLGQLEQRVLPCTTGPTRADTPGSQPEKTPPTPTTRSTPRAAAQTFDLDQFTEQQKRILAVFFSRQGARMSYMDVARILNKSAYTIKNQMQQIRKKADLFDRSVGRQCRNFFTLKNDLRIEKYLNLNRSLERPVSTPWPVQSSDSE